MINIAKVTASKQSGDQNSELARDGQEGVATQVLAHTGTAYRPNSGDLVVTMPIEGNSGNSFCISIEKNGAKVTLQEGEIAVGHFASGAYAVFKNDGTIESFGTVKHNGNVTITGNLTVTGNTATSGAATVTGQLTSGSAVIGGKPFATHTHPNPEGGNTGGVN